MRRCAFYMLAILLLLMLSGCGSGSSDEMTFYDDGSFSSKSNGGATSYGIASLPFDMRDGEVVIPLHSVSFYEIYQEHGYVGFVIVALDRSALTDDDIYWMTKSEELAKTPEISANAYLTSKSNELDGERMHFSSKVYDENFFYFVFESDKVRYDLRDGEISAQVIIAPTGSTIDETTNYYHYTLELDESEDYQDLDRLTAGEIDALLHAIEQ